MTTKQKAGRPMGSRAKAPRKGSRAEKIVKAYDKGKCKTVRELMKKVKDAQPNEVCQTLWRWRPEWKERFTDEN